MQTKKTTVIKVAMADDHVLLRDALANLVNNFDSCQVISTVNNGSELVESITKGQVPDVVILDLNMPIMDGYETALWLQKKYPKVHILMLTMYDSEIALIRLLQAGVKGFLKKDIHPTELQYAIQQVVENGFYYSQTTSGKLAGLFRVNDENELALQKTLMTNVEIEFLRLSCTEMTYKEIAGKMGLNPRSVDNLRDSLFTKLDVKSRIGLAMYAIKNGLVNF